MLDAERLLAVLKRPKQDVLADDADGGELDDDGSLAAVDIREQQIRGAFIAAHHLDDFRHLCQYPNPLAGAQRTRRLERSGLLIDDGIEEAESIHILEGLVACSVP